MRVVVERGNAGESWTGIRVRTNRWTGTSIALQRDADKQHKGQDANL